MNKEHPSIHVVIVFFHPSEQQVENARKIGRNYPTVVVDNSPEALDSFGGDKIKYIPLLENKGIAYAQNRGIEYALRQGADYIVTFDQDSRPEDGFIQTLYKQFETASKAFHNVMAIGPIVIDEETGKEYKNEMGNSPIKEVTALVSSGMLTSREAFEMAGLYEEKLFIDLVDHEWCFRLKSMGGAICMTRGVCLKHKVGNSTHRILGIQLLSADPFRYYYKTRNTLWLHRRNYPPRLWKIKSCVRLVGTMAYYLITSLYDNHSREIYYNIRRGFRDGLREQAFSR